MRRSSFLPTLLTAILTLGVSASSWGQVVLMANHCATDGVDLAYDTTDDTLWVADQLSGSVCHYQIDSLPPALTLIGSITHDFGPQVFPNPGPRISGVAYNSSGDTLFVLEFLNQEVRETNKVDGSLVGAPFFLTPSAGDASLFGLTHDGNTNTLWTLDVVNETLLNFDLAGTQLNAIPVPTNVPGEILYGRGLTFVESSNTIDVVHGTTLDFTPVSVVQVDLTGTRTGVEVDLTDAPDEIFGVVRPPVGSVIYACSALHVYSFDATQPSLLPPTGLTCLSLLDGSMRLSWTNNGPGSAYQLISVESTAGPTVQINGTDTTYTDTTAPPNTTITYTVTGFQGMEGSATTCTITTGTGALIDYVPFDGVRVTDLALDPATNRLYVTDAQPGAGDGLIYVYAADSLAFVEVLDTGMSDPLVGICFNTVTGNLVVSRSTSALAPNLLQRIDPITGAPVGPSFPGGATGTEIGSLSYDPVGDYYKYLRLDVDPHRVVVIQADENASVGAFIEDCAPPVTGAVDFSLGLKALDDGNMLVVTVTSAAGANAGIQQYAPSSPICLPTIPPLTIQVDGIGASVADAEGLQGIEVTGNLVYVAGTASNTIFRLLLAASGSLFIRGDANGSGGAPDLADVIFIADYLFTEAGPAPVCQDAADVNDDGIIDISDPLYLIIYEFLMGPEPPAPFPTEGIDPTFLDGLPC